MCNIICALGSLVLSLAGNSFVLAVFYRNNSLRTPVHYFIVNTAISDMIIPVIVLPWLIAEAYQNDVWLVDGVLGSILCKLVWVAWLVSVAVSILSMVVTAIDRFYAVLFATKPALITQKMCIKIIFVIWVSSLLFRAHLWYAMKLTRHNNRPYCVFQFGSPSESTKALSISWISWSCLSFLSAIVLTVLYTSVGLFLCRQKKNLHLASEIIRNRSNRNRRITCMLVIIVVLFYASSFPVNVLTYALKQDKTSCFLAWFVTYVLPMLSPVGSPVIYYVFIKDYRRGFRELLCCPWRCTNKCNQCSHSLMSAQCVNNLNTNVAQTNSGGIGAVVRSLPPNPEVPGSIPGLVEG